MSLHSVKEKYSLKTNIETSHG